MSTKFKIVHIEDEKCNLVNGDLEKFPQYSDIKKKILEATNKNDLVEKFAINEDDRYVLNIKGQTIGGLEKIWDQETYEYILRKKDSVKNKIIFVLEIVKEYPKFERPSNKDIALKIIESELELTKKKIIDALPPVKLEEASEQFLIKRKDYIESSTKGEEHKNIVCNRCLEANFKGKRYMCSECNNYNLCGKCESLLNQLQFHNRDHTFILYNKAVEDNNILKFNNSIVPKEFVIQVQTDVDKDIKFTVVNCGTENLNECFIVPIRFGSSFLTCEKKIIEDLEPKSMQEIELKVKLLNDTDPDPGIYKGFFRMFTKESLPFGDIITVTYTYQA